MSLIPVSDGTAANLDNVVKTFFEENNIPYQNNLIGFAADGAATMMGNNNSAYVLLERDVPELFILSVSATHLLCALVIQRKIFLMKLRP